MVGALSTVIGCRHLVVESLTRFILCMIHARHTNMSKLANTHTNAQMHGDTWSMCTKSRKYEKNTQMHTCVTAHSMTKHTNNTVHAHARWAMDILTRCSRKNTGVTNNSNDSFILFECPSKSWQRASEHNARTLTLKQLNGIQPSFVLLFTPVLLLLWHVKISSVKKA